jgi:hypothetical protein
MNQAELTTFLGWCSVLNFSILLFWAFAFFKRNTSFFSLIQSISGSQNSVEKQTFNQVNLAGLSLFETLFYFLNLVPWLVLKFMM